MKNINFNKNETESRIEIENRKSRTLFKREPCASSHIRMEIKTKEKRGHFLYRLFCSKGIFLAHVFYLIIFFKTSFLKNFAIFTEIGLC